MLFHCAGFSSHTRLSHASLSVPLSLRPSNNHISLFYICTFHVFSLSVSTCFFFSLVFPCLSFYCYFSLYSLYTFVFLSVFLSIHFTLFLHLSLLFALVLICLSFVSLHLPISPYFHSFFLPALFFFFSFFVSSVPPLPLFCLLSLHLSFLLHHVVFLTPSFSLLYFSLRFSSLSFCLS